MRFHSALASAIFVLPVLALTIVPQRLLDDGEESCPTARLFCVRGTTEKPGCGALQGVIDMVKEKVPGADQEAIVYPAAGIEKDKIPNFLIYAASETIGIVNLTAAMQAFYDRCPQTPTALLGYSQGAQVVGDVLCGRDMIGFRKTDPIPDKYTAQVRAILQFGDPSDRRPSVIPWHQGNVTSSFGGFFPRSDASVNYCKQRYQNKWQSWCDKATSGEGDVFCAKGRCPREHPGQKYCPALQIHLEYVVNHGVEVASWIAQQLPSKSGDDDVIDLDL